jgi:hypothetical protein
MPKVVPKLPRNAESIDPEIHSKSSAKSVRKAAKRAAVSATRSASLVRKGKA